MDPRIIAGRCFFCKGSGRVDWREGPNVPAIVTMEAHGLRMVDCPHCNGLGVVPQFASLVDVDLTHLVKPQG